MKFDWNVFLRGLFTKSNSSGKVHSRRVRPRMGGAEVLEERRLLSATPTEIKPLWFQPVAPTGGPETSSAVTADSGPRAETTAQSWIVRFRSDAVNSITSMAQTSDLVAGAPGEMRVIKGLGQVGQLLLRTHADDATATRWFASNPAIQAFERDSVVSGSSVPNDPYFSLQHNLDNRGQSSGKIDADIDAPEAWNLTTGSRAVVVAVVDSGIDLTHPDLVDNLWTNPGEIAGDGLDNDGNGFVDDIHGWDFVNNDNDPTDDHAHGTFVSGILGASGNNGTGVAGVAWQVSLMAVKSFGADTRATASQLVQGLNYIALMHDRGINVPVSNNSWEQDGFSAEIDLAVAAHAERNILFVAAAGNGSTNSDIAPVFPAALPQDNIISVAASDNRDRLSFFSNYGRTSVDLAAPGGTATQTHFNDRDILSTIVIPGLHGFQYFRLAGTSAAAPHVAGVAALGWALKPDASMKFIRDAILGGIDKLPQFARNTATGGRLNSYGALRYLQEFDLRIVSATVANSQLTVVYEVKGGQAPTFDLAFYRSENTQFDASDSLLATRALSAAADLTPGVHTKVFRVGTRAGQVPLPPVSASYSLLAVIDPLDQVTERGGDASDPNNIALIPGPSSAGLQGLARLGLSDTLVAALSGGSSSVPGTFSAALGLFTGPAEGSPFDTTPGARAPLTVSRRARVT